MRRARAVFSIAALFSTLWSSAPVLAQPAFEPGCQSLLPRFEHLIGVYQQAGRDAIGATGDVAEALERARNENLAGKAEASIRIVGVALSMRLSTERYSVATIRQICTFADRNSLPIHVLSCAYFTALNPMGTLDDKRAMVERLLEKFATLDLARLPDAQALQWRDHAGVLKACLPG